MVKTRKAQGKKWRKMQMEEVDSEREVWREERGDRVCDEKTISRIRYVPKWFAW